MTVLLYQAPEKAAPQKCPCVSFSPASLVWLVLLVLNVNPALGL